MSLSFDSNNSNQDNIYGAIVVAQSHFKSWPSSFDECWLSASWPPTLRPCQITWAASLPNTGCSYSHSPSPFFTITQLVSWYSVLVFNSGASHRASCKYQKLDDSTRVSVAEWWWWQWWWSLTCEIIHTLLASVLSIISQRKFDCCSSLDLTKLLGP